MSEETSHTPNIAPDGRFEQRLGELRASANLRRIPDEGAPGMVDLTSNDYLGIAARLDWQEDFLAALPKSEMQLTSSASRLLASRQTPYRRLESLLEELYGRPGLLFNSGYHANTGTVSALADSHTLILADKLVHASIIDGIMLSKAPFKRFRHNDLTHLERLIAEGEKEYDTILVIVESVYSMDGDRADIDALIDIKRRHPAVMLYVDEAHAFGVCGPSGLGLVKGSVAPQQVDVVIGTLGKAAASSGAFAIISATVRDYLINRSRSLIFSTCLPPVTVLWSLYVIERLVDMGAERHRLEEISRQMSQGIAAATGRAVIPSHIQPVIIGDPALTLALSSAMSLDGVKVLPIRTPTVPPGTERLRFSLNAALSDADIALAVSSLSKHLQK